MGFVSFGDCRNLSGEEQAKCFLRLAIQAELDMVNLYNAMADTVDDDDIEQIPDM